MSQRFHKEERLKSRKMIQAIFNGGKSLKAFPVIAVYVEDSEFDGVKVGFSVSRKRFKKAVDRNLLKRRMLEAYRLNRDNYGIQNHSGLALMLIYVSAEKADYTLIEKKVCRILEKLGEGNSVKEPQSEED